MKGKLQVASVRQIWCDILPALWQMEQCGSQTARVLGIWSESKQGALSLTRCGEVQGGVGCGFRVGYCTMRELHQPQRWKDEAGSRVYCLQQTDISLQMISQSTSDKTPPDFIRRWQDSHCTFALCLFSVPLWFQTSKIAQTQMFFFSLTRLPSNQERQPAVFLSVAAAEDQAVNMQADGASEENNIHHPLFLHRNMAIWEQQRQSTSI